ncbi:MAG: CHAT domain-containing protein [Saprospiraceae bacterium]|nr:CHAT domain-containing protein [Saprospiraceae bacterium]
MRLCTVLIGWSFAFCLNAQTPDTLEASRLLAESSSLYQNGASDMFAVFEKAKRSKDLFTQALGKNHVRVGEAWRMMAMGANFLPNETPKVYFDNAYLVFKTSLGPNHPSTIFCRAWYGTLFGYAGDYETALEILETEAARFTEELEAPSSTLNLILSYISNFSLEAGDLEKSMLYNNKIRQMLEKFNLTGTRIGAMNLVQLSAILEKQGDIQQAIEARLKAIQIYEKYIELTHPAYAQELVGLSMVYLENREADQASSAAEKAAKILESQLGKYHASLIHVYAMEGEAYALKKQHQKALDSWNKALAVSRVGSNRNFLRHRNDLYLGLAQFHFNQQAFASAKSWCDSVLVACRFDPMKGLTEEQPVADWPNLTRALALKCRVLQAWCEKSPSAELSHQFITVNACLGDCLQYGKKPEIESVFDPQLYQKVLLPASEAALDFEHFNEKDAATRVGNQYRTAQFAKAEALVLGFHSNRVKHIDGLPDSLLQIENKLKKNLAELRSKVAEAEAQKDSVALQKYVVELFEKKQAFNRLQQTIDQRHPRFAKLRTETVLPSIEELRKNLLSDQQSALIEYFVGEKHIYVFRLTHEHFESWQLNLPANFDSLIVSFRQATGDHVLMRNDPLLSKSMYSKAATALSDLLLSKALEGLPETTARLIIVPDGPLHYIAFEALLTEHVAAFSTNQIRWDWRNLPYLVKKFAVSYGYSSSLLMEQNVPLKSRPPRMFAGFAPKYALKNMRLEDTLATRSLAVLVRNGQYELPGAQKEVTSIQQLIGGELFQDQQASEAQFRAYAKNYNVLHLAMHALVDDRNTSLTRLLFSKTPNDSLYDNQLSCGEIYALSLPAEMAVLTACNSGYGKLGRGEGAMSLARAFTFAGVRSTVTSLWQSPDERTERLMVLFYENLKKGMAKDMALQQAKLASLSETENQDLGHPFFWAGCVLNGNRQPLTFTAGPANPYLLGALAVMVMLLLGAVLTFKSPK